MLIINKQVEPSCCVHFRTSNKGQNRWAGFGEHPVWCVLGSPILLLGSAECHPRVSPAEALQGPQCHTQVASSPSLQTRAPSTLRCLSQVTFLVHPGPQQLGVFLATVTCRHNSSPPEETNLLISCLLWRDAAPGSSPPPASHIPQRPLMLLLQLLSYRWSVQCLAVPFSAHPWGREVDLG